MYDDPFKRIMNAYVRPHTSCCCCRCRFVLENSSRVQKLSTVRENNKYKAGRIGLGLALALRAKAEHKTLTLNFTS